MQNNQALAIGIMILAAALRLAAPHEYEFKADEQAMVEMVQHARASGELPWLGMPTSQGFRNPGMSAWPFIALSFFSGTTRFGLTQAVRVLNVLAFVLALLWALRMRGETQKLWLLGLMLAAVNPLDVVLHRKLWAQSILPIFGLCVTWCWWNRKKHWGFALGLGASAAVISQIHLSGLFFSAALFAAALFDRQRQKVAWWAAAAGLIALGWPMVFWVQHLLVAYESSHAWVRNVLALRSFHLLLSNLSGVVMSYSLGGHFEKFVANPIVYGAHAALILLTLFAVVQFFRRKRLKISPWESQLNSLLLYGILGTCTLMTLAGVYGERHYYLGMFPLPYVALASFLRTKQSRWPVYTVAGLQFIVSVAFLWFIHVNHGAPGADFGGLPPQ